MSNRFRNNYRKLSEEEKILPGGDKKPDEGKGITIEGIDNIMFHRSKCCYPLPGEKVVGFVTRGRGVSIHMIDCPTLDTNTIDADRLLEVEWTGDGDATYAVKVQVLTVDKRGLLAELSAVLSTLNVNINHLDASSTHEKKALFNFTLEIRDKQLLDQIIAKISLISGVFEVKRIQT